MQIRYFASLKEQIGKESEELNGFNTLEVLIKHLESCYGVFDSNIIIAVNLVVTNNTHITLKDTDEIAFYPPVTGG